MITNLEIYRRAVDLFEDPHISRAYYFDTVKFCKMMYPFLRNGISRITAPTSVAALLAEQQSPVGSMETIDIKENTLEYALDFHPDAESLMAVYINGKGVNNVNYSTTFNTITIPAPLTSKDFLAVEWYLPGGFTGDFSKINGRFPLNSLVERTTDLLAQATALSWAMQKRSSLLEGVLNNLTDTDFKVHSPAASLTAKKEWVENLRLELMNSQNKLDWDMRNQNRSYYGY